MGGGLVFVTNVSGSTDCKQSARKGGKHTFVMGKLQTKLKKRLVIWFQLLIHSHACCVYVQHLQETPYSSRGQLAENNIWRTEATKVSLAIEAHLMLHGCFRSSSRNAANLTERGSFVGGRGGAVEAVYGSDLPQSVYVHIANGTELFKPFWSEITGFLLGNWYISGTEVVPVF